MHQATTKRDVPHTMYIYENKNQETDGRQYFSTFYFEIKSACFTVKYCNMSQFVYIIPTMDLQSYNIF